MASDSERLRDWLERVHRRWSFLGLSEAEQRVLGRELAADIEAVLADGVPLDEFVNLDPVRFADQVADRPAATTASPSPGRPWTPWTGAQAGVSGAALSVVVLLLSYYPFTTRILDGTPFPMEWLILPIHVVAGLLAIAGALAAVRWWFGPAAASRRALSRVGAGLAIGGLLAILPVQRLAQAWNYPIDLTTVTIEVVLAAAFCFSGIAAAVRLQGWRSP